MTATTLARTVADLSFLLSHASHVLATRMAAAFAEIGVTPRAYCVLFHALEAERTQIQSGLFNTTQQVGGALGVGVLATLATARTGSLLTEGYDAASALSGGFRLAFGVGAGLVAAAFLPAVTVLREPTAPETTAVTAQAPA